jgi:hypothetical protein
MNKRMLAVFAAALPVFLLAAMACLPGDDSGGSSDTDREVVDAPIDEVDILVRESFPPGYTAHIKSGLPSGCAKFESAQITGRSGNTITIAVKNTIPADKDIACTAIYGTHESNVDLGQDFVSGQTYTVKVNDVTETFVAQ